MAAVRKWLTSSFRGRAAIPLADAPHLRVALLRTTLIRLGLGGLLVAAAALAAWRAAHLDVRPVSFLPAGSTTLITIDQSKSIYPGAYRRIAEVLRKLIAADVPVGMVAFSDTSYEMFPPGARGSDLEPLLRFYTPANDGTNIDPTTAFRTTPWDNIFAGGTKISSGLELAEQIIHRDRVRNGTILLLSDLQTASDDQLALAQALERIRRDPDVRLKIVPLAPLAQDRAFFQRFVPRSDFITAGELEARGSANPHHSLVAGTPWSLVALCAVLLVLLGANELLCGRLELARPRAEAT